MAYNTGNSLGSTDPRDLSDNSENFDRFANGSDPAYNDRFGTSRKSFAGMESEFDADQATRAIEFQASQDDRDGVFTAYLVSAGYQFAGDYAAGIEVTAYTQVIRESGEFWRASASTSLPYTTTGAGMPEGGAFVNVGDAALRQELANSPSTGQGATLVNGATIYVGSVAELEALSLTVGTNVYLTEEGRAGEFVVKAGTPPSDPQKGIYIVLANGNYAARADKTFITPEMFEAEADGVADDTDAFDAVKALGFTPYTTSGKTYKVTYTDSLDLFDVVGGGTVTNGFVSVAVDQLYGALSEKEDQRNDTPSGPYIRRQRSTTENISLFVDPNASASGNGSQGSPFKSINEALSLIPREIYHAVRIYLSDGLYVGADNTFTIMNYFVTPRSTAGLQIIGHVTENPLYGDDDPTAVVIGNESTSPENNRNNYLIGGINGDTDDTKIVGVTIDGRVQIYGTPFGFDRVNFKTGKGAELSCLSGHSGRIKANRCDFSDAGIAADIIDNAHFFFNLCTGSNLTRPAFVRNGSILLIEESPTLISGASYNISIEGNCIGKIDGRYLRTGIGIESFSIGNETEDSFQVSQSGDLICTGGFEGGVSVINPIGTDKFGLYMNGAGNIYLRVDVEGTEKVIQLVDYANGDIPASSVGS